MGVDANDFDQDGRQDLIVANIDTQTTSLYRNIGQEMFDDVNLKTGISQATRMMSGWGLRFLDYHNDGWPDLILSNGHPDDAVESRNAGIGYRQPLLLMHNLAGAKMENVSAQGGCVHQEILFPRPGGRRLEQRRLSRRSLRRERRTRARADEYGGRRK
jgi:hypothetical protein